MTERVSRFKTCERVAALSATAVLLLGSAACAATTSEKINCGVDIKRPFDAGSNTYKALLLTGGTYEVIGTLIVDRGGTDGYAISLEGGGDGVELRLSPDAKNGTDNPDATVYFGTDGIFDIDLTEFRGPASKDQIIRVTSQC